MSEGPLIVQGNYLSLEEGRIHVLGFSFCI